MASQAETWLLLNSGPGRTDLNMALDETLLDCAAQAAKPVLRFYGWTERAASFGYSQRFVEVEAERRLAEGSADPTQAA